MVDTIREQYADRRTADLAKALGMTPVQVRSVAHRLKLYKSKAFLAAQDAEYSARYAGTRKGLLQERLSAATERRELTGSGTRIVRTVPGGTITTHYQN